MELDEALHRISEIHGQILRGAVFRGYRAATQAAIGGLGILGAALQPVIVGAPFGAAAVNYWVAIALLAMVLLGIDVTILAARSGRTALKRNILPVLAQYLPTLIAGAVLTYALRWSSHVLLLPGLWAFLHALGIFASRPYLPRAVGWVSLWFLAVGGVMLLGAASGQQVTPWAMGLSFGGGQVLLAAVLHLNLEREPTRGGHGD